MTNRPGESQKRDPDGTGSDGLESSILWPGSQDFTSIDDPATFPRFVRRSDGPYVWDVRGDRYVDLFSGSGAVILGHDAVRDRSDDRGPRSRNVSLRHPLEVELGHKIRRLIPFVDYVSYFKTGSEAVTFALQAALGQAEGDTVVSVGYHGWLPPLGGERLVPDQLTVVEADPVADDVLELIAEHRPDLATVVFGPEPGLADADFYEAAFEATRDAGAKVVMDEIKSGFRLAFPCLSSEVGVAPDFLLLGKAVANGSPLAILCANESRLRTDELPSVFSTFASEPRALSSAMRTIEALEDGGYAEFEEASGTVFDVVVDHAGEESVVGTSTYFELQTSPDVGASLSERLLEEGVLLHPSGQVLVSAAHNQPSVLDPLVDDLSSTLSAVEFGRP